MIITIALNPGIEKRIVTDELIYGGDQEVLAYELRIAPSGVHCAYIMKLLQAEPYVLGFAGGIGGRYIKNFLDKNRIKSDFISKDQELESVFVLEAGNQLPVRLVDHASKLEELDARNFKHRLVRHIQEGELIVMNGDTYDPMAVAIILDSIGLAKQSGKRVVLSLEGESLIQFLSTSPYAVVLDQHQLSTLIDDQLSELEIAQYLHNLVRTYKIRYIFYLKSDGIIGVSKNKIAISRSMVHKERVLPWEKEAVAGTLAVGIKRQYPFERLLKLATGVTMAMNDDAYPTLCTRKDVDYHSKKIRIKEIYSKGEYKVRGEYESL